MNDGVLIVVGGHDDHHGYGERRKRRPNRVQDDEGASIRRDPGSEAERNRGPAGAKEVQIGTSLLSLADEIKPWLTGMCSYRITPKNRSVRRSARVVLVLVRKRNQRQQKTIPRRNPRGRRRVLGLLSMLQFCQRKYMFILFSCLYQTMYLV